MHVSYTDEQNLIRSMVRDFAIKELEPTAAQRDEEERFDRLCSIRWESLV